MGKVPKKFGRNSNRPVTEFQSTNTPLASDVGSTLVPSGNPGSGRPLDPSIVDLDNDLENLWNGLYGLTSAYITKLGETPNYNKTMAKDMMTILEKQNFNGKPVVYEDEESFAQAAENDAEMIDGSPLMIVRSMPYREYADAVLGDAPVFVHVQPGYYGSGTYWMNEFHEGELKGARSTMEYVNTVGIGTHEMYGAHNPEYVPWEYVENPGVTAKTTPTTIAGFLRKGSKTNINEIIAPDGKMSKPQFESWLREISDDFRSRYGRIHPNIGVMAAMLGYDAVVIPHAVNGVGQEVMVFNRAATGVLRTPIRTTDVAQMKV